MSAVLTQRILMNMLGNNYGLAIVAIAKFIEPLAEN